MAKKVIFQVNGGIGKCIMSTAVLSGIKEKYPEHEIIVISGYPDVYVGNQRITKSYGFGQVNYFYEDHIEGNEIVAICQDPYNETAFIQQNKQLIEIWYDMAGLEYKGQKPELFLSDREIQFHQTKIQGTSGKPLLFIQSNGGADGQVQKYSWARDIPTSVMNKLIEHYSPKYDIVHIRRADQIAYNGTLLLNDEFRAVASIMLASNKRVFMDSFAQHTAAALNLPSTVLWIANKPEVFGYELHKNILANPETKKGELKTSFLQKYDISGNPIQFPYNSEEEIFNIDEIIAAIGD